MAKTKKMYEIEAPASWGVIERANTMGEAIRLIKGYANKDAKKPRKSAGRQIEIDEILRGYSIIGKGGVRYDAKGNKRR